MGERELPKGWERAKLGDVIEFNYGKSLPARKRDDGEFPVYGSNGVVGSHSIPLIKEPCLIVGRKGSIGEVHFSRKPCHPIDTTYFINEFYDQPIDFWLYLLKSLNLSDLNRATALPGLNRNDAYDLDLPLPPLNEQKRIADKIEVLQSHSEKAREALEKIPDLLDRFRQSVLAAAFRGDLTADWRAQNPDVEPASQLLERIRRERRQKWEEGQLAKMEAKGKVPKNDKWKKKYKEPEPVDASDLPELPKGWCWVSVAEVASDVPKSLAIGPFGSNLLTSDYREEGVPLVFVRDIRAESFGGEGTKYVEPEKAKELSSHLVRGGDLLITKMGDPPGDTVVYPESRPNAVITSDCIKLAPDARLTDSQYLMFVIRSYFVKKQILKISKGVAQQKVSLKRFRGVLIPIPPKEEQVVLTEHVEEVLLIAKALENKINNSKGEIESLDQSILAKAFRGELVPQDPNDEPTSVLLERIRQEREETKAKK